MRVKTVLKPSKKQLRAWIEEAMSGQMPRHIAVRQAEIIADYLTTKL